MEERNTSAQLSLKEQKRNALQAAQEAYEVLSPEQKEILKTRCIDGSHTPEEWRVLFEGLTDYDAKIDAYTDLYPKRYSPNEFFIWIFIYLFVGMFVIVFMSEAFPISAYPFLLTFYLGLPAGAIAWRILYRRSASFQLRKLNLPNYFRLFTVPLINFLEEEMQPRVPVKLFLEMDTVLKKSYKTNKAHLLDYQKQFTNTVFTEYHTLKLQARLADRVRINLSVWTLIRSKVRYKRKGDKYKLRGRTYVQIRVIVPKRFYTLKQTVKMPSQIKYGQLEDQYIFKTKSMAQVYQTLTTTKGNHNREHFELQEAVSNTKTPELWTVLNLIKDVYTLLEPKKRSVPEV